MTQSVTIQHPISRAETIPARDPRAPMPAAPMVYNDDGSVAWDQMWDSFCVLASAGGPPHRGQMLQAPAEVDASGDAYRRAVDEIIRGTRLVSGLEAVPAEPGWIAVACGSAAQAAWLSDQICQENVASYARGMRFFVPVDGSFLLKGEIKNVITVVAKTTHYWDAHLAAGMKRYLAWETATSHAWQRLRRWFGR